MECDLGHVTEDSGVILASSSYIVLFIYPLYHNEGGKNKINLLKFESYFTYHKV